MATITLPDVSTDWLRAIFTADTVGPEALWNITVTQNGVARTIQGIYYMRAPQEVENPYPGIIIDVPLLRFLPQPFRCNGVFLKHASFHQDVIFAGRDVEPDDPGLEALRARAEYLVVGNNGSVTGGAVTTANVHDYPRDLITDRGSYIYSEKFITFQIATQVS